MAKVRDLVGGLTHCIAASLSLVGLVMLIVFASIYGNAYHVVTFTIYGSSLVLLYLFSTLYHWLKIRDNALSVFRKFDNIMLYIFIAASYTTICLIPLRGPWGWSIFGVEWGLALTGILFTAIWTKVPKAITTSIYLTMSFLILIIIYPLIKALTMYNLINSIWWLFAGGVFYILGGIKYGLKFPKINLKHFKDHDIFHIFIILGSACHYWFIIFYLLKIS